MSATAISESPAVTPEDCESSASELSRYRLQDSQLYKEVLLIFSLLTAVTYGLTNALVDVFLPSHLYMGLLPSWLMAIPVGLLSIPLAAAVTCIQMKVGSSLSRRFCGAKKIWLALLFSSALVAPMIGSLIFIGTTEVNDTVSTYRGVGGMPEGVANEVASGGHNTKVGRSIIATLVCLLPAWISTLLIARHFDTRARRFENGESNRRSTGCS